MDLDTAGTLLTFSNLSLLIGAVLVAAGTFGSMTANSTIQKYDEIRQLETEVKIAEATEASSVADARAASANLKSAEANERAAKLENETSLLKKQAEEAKAEAAKVKERLQKMQTLRKLTIEQAQKISDLLKSDKFIIDPPVTLGIAAVADSEAQMFAMEFMNLLISCRVNIGRTPYGGVNDCIQLAECQDGLLLSVNSAEITPEGQPFVHLANLLASMGLTTAVQEDPMLPKNEARLSVLRKPTEN